MGLRLRDIGPDFTWHDLAVITRNLPLDSALSRAHLGPDYQWTLANLLAAAEVDALRVANWQRSDAKKSDYPKPIQRPGIGPEPKVREAVSMDEMRERLERKRHLSVVADPAPAPPPAAPVRDPLAPPERTVELEHELGIVGHEADCDVCNPPNPSRKRDEHGRFTK